LGIGGSNGATIQLAQIQDGRRNPLNRFSVKLVVVDG